MASGDFAPVFLLFVLELARMRLARTAVLEVDLVVPSVVPFPPLVPCVSCEASRAIFGRIRRRHNPIGTSHATLCKPHNSAAFRIRSNLPILLLPTTTNSHRCRPRPGSEERHTQVWSQEINWTMSICQRWLSAMRGLDLLEEERRLTKRN